jgi:hypothetical protein
MNGKIVNATLAGTDSTVVTVKLDEGGEVSMTFPKGKGKGFGIGTRVSLSLKRERIVGKEPEAAPEATPETAPPPALKAV